MLAHLIDLSLRHRAAVLLCALALLVLGAERARQMPIDVFPDLTAPRVTVVTEASGLPAEEIEPLVTLPIETAVNGATGLRRVRSASAAGISVVWAEFDWSVSPTLARQAVTERLQAIVSTLPAEAAVPVLAPASSVMGEIAFVALTSDRVTAMELRRLADVEVRRRLLAVAGVAQVVAIGGEVEQYQVVCDPLRLVAYHLTAGDVVAALDRGSRNTAGGYAVAAGQESVVRVLARAAGSSDLEAIVVAVRGGTPVHVRDVATVARGPAPVRGMASVDTKPAVLLSVVKQPDASTSATTARLDVELAALASGLQGRGVTLHREVFRQQDFIDRSVANVLTVLRDGAGLVVVVLLGFLWSLRPTLISALALPLSLGVAVLVLDLAGMTLDTMTLGGLAIAIGELVDDAIVDVENVVRRLRQWAARPVDARPPALATVLRASLEVRAAIASATWVVMLVFVPLLLLDGLEGRLLRPLAVAYLAAIFGSLVVAVTVTPVLCSLLLPAAALRRSAHEPPVLRALERAYAPALALALRRPLAVVVAAAVVVATALAGFAGMGRAFLPEFNEGSLTIQMVLTPGTSLHESDALARLAERALLADPGVLSVGRRTGRAEADEHVLGAETTELEVRVHNDDPRTRTQLFADVRERLRAVPAAFTLGQPISHRIEHMVSGQRTALAVKVFGDDLRALRETATQVKAALATVAGLTDLDVEQAVDVPHLVVRPDAHAAAEHGMSAGEVATAIGTLLWGTTATRLFADGRSVDVVVRGPQHATRDVEAVRALQLVTPAGRLATIGSLADVQRDAGPNYILRENAQRRVAVTANLVDRDAAQVVADARLAVAAQVRKVAGVRIEFAGQFEREAETSRRLLGLSLLSLIGIGLIVAATLRSARRALIVLVNLPLALAGGVVGVWLAGGVLSVATTIGFITLFGIATRNGILLATRTRDLELDGCLREAAVAQAAQERLAPILMTAATAGLGLLPLALALGRAGSEIQAPMALVILTGLATSTALNMVVVPALLVRWGGVTRRGSLSHQGRVQE
ncbi:MAG: efflux RND transporter permease subunit [Myxococcales bacterium]|nr:efflux RND transporter permease subunit [Myxococcales bacterium]